MPYNFYAIVVEDGARVVKRLLTSRSLQNQLTGVFESQAAEFLDEQLSRVRFDALYHVQSDELFIIHNFAMMPELLEAAKHPRRAIPLRLDQSTPPKIQAIVAATYDPNTDAATMYFQVFTATRLLRQGLTILLQQDTFQKVDDAGLTLDSKLAAAYANGNLLFRSYQVTNRFLDLTNYFKEATDREVEEVLSHERIFVADSKQVIALLDTTMRKRFTAVKASDVLNVVSPRKIRDTAGGFGLSISVCRNEYNHDAIEFPIDKKAMKELLTFLNEGYYHGELTGDPYVTNSRRKLRN